jgi:hypothetical protein
MKGAPIRYQQTGEFHFLTFSCFHRRPYLSAGAAMDLFEDALERVRRRYLFVVGRLCRDARARASARQRARARAFIQNRSGPQAVGLDAQPRKTLLAGALL